jgi:FkbM family methyltransferase
VNAFKKGTVALLDRVLPRRTKEALFHLSYHLAPLEFRRFAYHYGYAPDMELGLEAIAGRGFAPRTVVDVGAYEGGWSRIARRLWPATRLIMIEANEEKQPVLRIAAHELGATLHCALLGAQAGRHVDFNVMGSGSSVLGERSPLERRVERRTLETLDQLLPPGIGSGLLKIDAQGYELEILRGATRSLGAFEAVLLEIALIEINPGAPLLHEVVAYMKERGYVAYDILEMHRRPLDQALNQIDIIFLRQHSPLLADKRHFSCA